MNSNKQRLQEELEKLEKRLTELRANWAETRGGSRYGDEYGEIQIKVYTKMIEEVREELRKLKNG